MTASCEDVAGEKGPSAGVQKTEDRLFKMAVCASTHIKEKVIELIYIYFIS